MGWTKEDSKIPTTVGNIGVILQDLPAFEHGQALAINTFDAWVPLEHPPNTGSVKVAADFDTSPFTEGVDYDVDYTNGAIKALSTGSMTVPAAYHITYEYRQKRALYSLVVLDQHGDTLREMHKQDLEPHLTAGEKTQLSSFLDTLRARAESQLL